MAATGGLSIFFVFFILFLAFRKSLIPDIIILGSFILFVLWLTGLIGTSIQLYGSAANVNSNCENYVVNQEYKGPSTNTLAWLTQITICKFCSVQLGVASIHGVTYYWSFDLVVLTYDAASKAMAGGLYFRFNLSTPSSTSGCSPWRSKFARQAYTNSRLRRN